MPLDRCLNFHNPTAGSWDSPSCPLIGQYWPLLWRHRSSKYAQLVTTRSFLWYLCLFNSNLLGRFVLRDKLLATVNQYILTFFDLFWLSCDVTGQKLVVRFSKLKGRVIALENMSSENKAWWPPGHRWRHRSGQTQNVWHFHLMPFLRKMSIINA